MIKNELRIGRLTSSKAGLIAATGTGLSGFSAGGLTYIYKVKAERNVGRSTDLGKFSKPMAWGKIAEYIAFEQKLDNEWEMVSKETLPHPRHKFWSGSPDCIVPREKVGEIKCYYPDKFYEFSSCLMMEDVDLVRKHFANEYWQVVSNASILRVKRGVLITYMPYYEDLVLLRERIEATDLVEKQLKGNPFDYKWIYDDDIETLPYVKNPNYPDLVTFEFEIPKDDLVYLDKRMQAAEDIINKPRWVL